MSYTYSQWLTALQNATQLYDETGAQIVQALGPTIVDYAEGRIYRDPELDLLSIRSTDTSEKTMPGYRDVPLPPGIMVIEEVALVTPAGSLPDMPGASRIPLLRTSKPFIDTTWPLSSQTAPPQPFETYFAIPGQVWTPNAGTSVPTGSTNHLIIGPTPDATYTVAIYGTVRPTPLYALPAGQMTVLSLVYPELFFAATMVAATGLVLKNWAAIADDPQSAATWEAQYNKLRLQALGEAARQRSQAPGWAAGSVPVLANMPRFGAPGSPMIPGAPIAGAPR
jgi:hypothetical protein